MVIFNGLYNYVLKHYHLKISDMALIHNRYMDEMETTEYSSIVQWFRNQWHPVTPKVEMKAGIKIGR